MTEKPEKTEGAPPPPSQHVPATASPFVASLSPDQLRIHEALCDSQFIAGAKAGWNAGCIGDPDAATAAFGALMKSRDGHLEGFADAKAALAAQPALKDNVTAAYLPIFAEGGLGDRLLSAMEACAATYVFSPDDDYADHILTDNEKAMLIDFVNWAFAQEAVNRILQDAARAVAPKANMPAELSTRSSQGSNQAQPTDAVGGRDGFGDAARLPDNPSEQREVTNLTVDVVPDGLTEDGPGNGIVNAKICDKDARDNVDATLIHCLDQVSVHNDHPPYVTSSVPHEAQSVKPTPAPPKDHVTGVDILRLPIGTPVQKVGGYPFPGIVVSTFHTLSGQERFVVEATGEAYRGMLHIFNGGQLRATQEGSDAP